MCNLWRDHSLSIVLGGLGVSISAAAFAFPEGKLFDTFLAVGTNCLGAAVIFIFAGPFRERNRPED